MKQRKRSTLVNLTLAAVLLSAPLAVSFPAQPTEAATKAKYTVSPQNFSIGGAQTTIKTINLDGTTYIALRDLSNGLGLGIGFDKATQAAKVAGKNRLLEINLKDSSFKLNDQLLWGPQLVVQDNTTFLPLRFILEQMGYVVGYDSATKLIALQGIQENEVKISAKAIAAEGNGKALRVYYPVLSGLADSGVQEKINAFLKKEADQHVAAAAKEVGLAVKENDQTLDPNSSASNHQLSVDGRFTVTYNEKGRLSLYVDYYVDFGGAHGVTSRVPYTFDLSTGNVLTLKEVANNTNYVSIINSKIKEQIKERKLELITPFETIEADRDFFLNRNGVVVYFTQYEYTPYAAGMPEFVIPYAAFQ
ncbi:stalk domain-containing protein [Paenibacillus barengoltzii]|uniref:stalk domain-containing protein n=1 Tax=Paenibacillus barengoltzii TaxID=343517 RepID=UPI000FDAA99A|nr:DUF3298 domain-containing protein [Paenibacillus barengoltzii]